MATIELAEETQKAIDKNREELKAIQRQLKETGVEEGASTGMNMLQRAIGADSHALLSHIVQKSAAAISCSNRDFNVTMESIGAEAPKDVVEARMISQASALYSQGMGMLAKMENTQNVDFMREYGNIAVKLLRAHNETVEALSRYRRGGEQRVTVVHVADKMAVVNNYGGGGVEKTNRTGHA